MFDYIHDLSCRASVSYKGIKFLKIVEIHIIFLSDCDGGIFILNDICCIFFICGSEEAYHFIFFHDTACKVNSVSIFNFIDIGYIFNNAVCREICKSVVKGIFYGLIVFYCACKFTVYIDSASLCEFLLRCRKHGICKL